MDRSTGEAGRAEAAGELYGPRGWSVRAGVWEVLAPFTARGHVPWAYPGVGAAVGADGRPGRDHVAFAGLDGAAALELLERLPPAQLVDRQNAAPTLGSMLWAAARHPGTVEVHGYGIGPQRADERVSAEGLVVYAFADLAVSPNHAPGCRCQELWALVEDVLELEGDGGSPDEIHRSRPPWARDREGWWLWWD
ncbi:hypothetical protein [Georgenia sp. AZ-5]|uniref:hypothetical protein n=1 Tax=Georgenia sp. AZ-5 TaxID=3367526 RepID=UPI00375470F6